LPDLEVKKVKKTYGGISQFQLQIKHVKAGLKR